MELSLDLSLSFVPKTVSEILGEVSLRKEGSQKMDMLEDFVKRLEDEMRKIQAFKRELPLCMILRSEENDRSVPNNPIQQTNKSEGTPQVPSLSLMTPAFELNRRSGSSLITRTVEVKGQSQPQQNPRKQRRCWSPELHRRFVDALQRLGGPQVATPKQIRELMQVGGLTNDEVKSHLQKYRLHVRRPQVCSIGEANGGLCMMAQDQCRDNKSKGNMSQSGSPQGPLFLGGSGKGFSSSGRNSIDTEEDEQSDCHNWKGGLHQQPETDVS
ncbi:hypothetical protein VNO77_25333 [Canavalia gladiata]|uniref:HTH myb-type domain-containing protein n=1 Tax=Canavalia gladiata TaxID=3824 RepID=A0AAN9LBB5_CANGL